MRENLETFFKAHKHAIARVAGVLFLAILVTVISVEAIHTKTAKQIQLVKQEQSSVKGTILAAPAVPVAPVPTTVSFGNIPDESFLPIAKGKIIRANLVTMQLTYYEDGVQIGGSMKILAKGKTGSFWETTGGSYPITDKEEDYYSERAGAYFPYTMHLFGSYMIHGSPHDENNNPLPHNQNGDIRLANDDAKTLYEWADTDTRVSVFSDSKLSPSPISNDSVYVNENGETVPKVSADSYLVGDLDTGEVILESNKDSVFPIASVSKLMTALVSIDTMNQFDLATVSKKATTVYSVNKFAVGEKITLSNLIYPLLLPSSNVAAEVIAEHAGRDTFLKEMNDQALKLNMENTHYDDPSGLSPKNVSTAFDLFLLTQNLFKEKPFIFNITLLPTYNAQGHYWKNVSQFLNVSGYLGGKSGQTDEAKQSNVAIFSLPLGEGVNRNIAIIVLHSNDRQSDTMKILAYLKSRIVYGTKGNFTITSGTDLSSDITMSFVGDIMLDRGVRYSVKTNFGGDYSRMFDHTDMIKQSDLAFANLEGPASDKGTDLHNLYSFRMDPAVLDVIRTAGFDVLSFANNHVGDWGRPAFEDTMARMDTTGLQYVGAGMTKSLAVQPKIFTIKGMKIGMIGFTDVGPDSLAATDTESGILLASDPDFQKIITDAKKQVDELIVSFHWGEEYQEHTPRQTMLAHEAIDAGANVIIGAHPHVPQAVETYHGGLIAYSLGNYIFDQAFSKETMSGMLIKLTFDAKSKTLKRYDKYSIQLSPEFQPQEPEVIK